MEEDKILSSAHICHCLFKHSISIEKTPVLICNQGLHFNPLKPRDFFALG